MKVPHLEKSKNEPWIVFFRAYVRLPNIFWNSTEPNITACPKITKETENLFGWALTQVREKSIGLEAVSQK